MIECCLSYACADVDGSVITNKSIPKWRRYTMWACLIALGCSIIVALVFGLLLFIRLNPYYFFGKTQAKKIYFVSLVFNIISIIAFCIFLSFLCKVWKRKKTKCVFMAFNFFVWISVACSFLCYLFGSPSIKTELSDNLPCSAPLDEVYKAILEKHPNEYDDFRIKFLDWHENLDINDICGNVLVPLLIIEILQFAFYITFAGFLSGCCCCLPISQVENDDEDQSQNQNDSANNMPNQLDQMIPNQNNPNQYPNQNNKSLNQAEEQNNNPTQSMQNLDINTP